MARLLGPILSSTALERAARELLADTGRLGIVCDEICRQEGTTDRVERVRSVQVRTRLERLADEQLPCVVLVCPGTVDVPRRDGGGRYSATWSLGVTAIAQSTSAAVGRDTAAIICAAAAALLLQELPSVDDRIRSVTWAGDASSDVPWGQADRSRHLATRGLEVTVDDIVCDLAGPLPPRMVDPPIGEPAADPGDLPVVEETDVTATAVEETTR